MTNTRKADNLLLGIVLIIIAGAMLASHDAMTKSLALGYPVTLIIWVRYTVQSVLLPLLFLPKMGKRLLHTYRPVLQLLRGISLLGVSLLLITGLRFIPLAEATAVIFLAPVFVTLLSALLLRETVVQSQWLAVGLGLLGVGLIVRPGGALFSWPILLPLAAAICFAIYQLLTRMLAGKDHPATSNFYSGLIGSLLLAPVALLQLDELQQMSTPTLGMLLALGAIAMTAHMLLTLAFRYASAVVLAPFTYVQIISAVVVGWLAFDQLPDVWALLGVLIIMAGGAWSGWQQMKRSAS
ncbi:MAG: EamA family transporter [Gammaproteobacteria bacterium]|nr:EamA family transporter [Gammaproteobacteria bacterium]